jgi:hypothetical protein
MGAAHVKVVEMDGRTVDGPEWITTDDGEHIPADLDTVPPGFLGAYERAAGYALCEVVKARDRFEAMASSHEGYAVLLEEVDELWDEVKGNKHDAASYRAAMRKEAIQVAAMALCFIVEVCDRGGD